MSNQYLCREDYLNAGVSLLQRVIRYDTEAAKDAYAAWLKRAQPSKGELQNVIRRASIAA